MNLNKTDFLALWNGRPKVDYLGYPACPIYVFNLEDQPKAPCDFVWLDWRYSEPNWGKVL